MSETWWRREQFGRRRRNLAARGRIITAIRDFFAARGFVEVETPALQRSPGMEPHLQAFATEWHHPGEGATPLYLHTSPEFAMKKLLAAGMPKIFQLARVFRDGERSPTHHPEFTMLEWYRAGAGYRDLMTDCEDLLRACLAAAEATDFRWKDRRCDPTRPFERLSMAEAFRRYCGIDLLATAPDPNAPSFDLLAAAAQPLGIAPHDGDEWEDLFFRIFLDWVEPQLGLEVPTLLYDYPIALAALARSKFEDARLAERFELYAAGLELANGFGELTDPVLQRVRFVADQEKKYRRYRSTYPIDEDFIAALGDMPDSAGIALGVDRLVMLATGASHIDDVLWAPVSPPQR
ncbi:MAG TPA: EF-P lysine aminoacylase EpmA [Stellaceae bacterium]|jgi:lysyl-tRNA synthetase class 2|nr:EF-P lysine aminoacylase EpmA [Stellaceae bacterium]